MSFKKLTDEELGKLSTEDQEKYKADLETFDKTPIGISRSDYENFKSKHRFVQAIIVEDYDGTARAGYFRRPTIPELKAAKKNLETDELDATLTLFNSCKLWVDAVVENDDFLKLSMVGQMGSIMKMQNSYIKNY